MYWNTAIKESKLSNELFCELRLIRLAIVPQGGNTGLVGIWISLSPLSLSLSLPLLPLLPLFCAITMLIRW